MKPRPKRGDVIDVDWVDIYADPTGDPRAAYIVQRTDSGRFWGWRNMFGSRVLVVTTAKESKEIAGQEGFVAYPWSCVKGLRIVEKRKR